MVAGRSTTTGCLARLLHYGEGMNTHKMTHFQITSEAGVDMGIFAGATPMDAMRAMHRDAGYQDDAAALFALALPSLDAALAELTITPVQVTE